MLEVNLSVVSNFLGSLHISVPSTLALKCNTPKEILNSPRVFSITPKVFSISPKEILMTLAKVTTPVTLVAIVGINTRILWAGNIFSLGRAQKKSQD